MSQLLDQLRSSGVLDEQALQSALRRQQIYGGSLDTVILELELLEPAILSEQISLANDCEAVPVALLSAGPERPWDALPRSLVDLGWTMPLRRHRGQVQVAVHPEIPAEQRRQLQIDLDHVEVLATCEAGLAKLAAERSGSVMPQRYAILALRWIQALERAQQQSPEPDAVAPAAPWMMISSETAPYTIPPPDSELSAPVAPTSRATSKPNGPRGRNQTFLYGIPLDDDDDDFRASPESSEDVPKPRPPAERGRASLPERLAGPRSALEDASGRDQTTDALVRAAMVLSPRSALFGIKREGLRGLASPGEITQVPGQLVEISPAIDDAIEGRQSFDRATDLDLRLAVGLERAVPCLFLPVTVHDRPVLMLYLDRKGDGFSADELDAARDLCEVAGSTLEEVLRRMRAERDDAAAPTSAPRASKPEPTPEPEPEPTPEPEPEPTFDPVVDDDDEEALEFEPEPEADFDGIPGPVTSAPAPPVSEKVAPAPPPLPSSLRKPPPLPSLTPPSAPKPPPLPAPKAPSFTATKEPDATRGPIFRPPTGPNPGVFRPPTPAASTAPVSPPLLPSVAPPSSAPSSKPPVRLQRSDSQPGPAKAQAPSSSPANDKDAVDTVRGRLVIDDDDQPRPRGRASSKQELDSAIQAAMRGGPGAVEALRDIGQPAMRRIAKRYPGELDVQRRDLDTLPPLPAHGALIRVALDVGYELGPYLVEIIDHPNATVRFYVAFIFMELRHEQAVGALSDLAFDPDADVRAISMRVLETYSGESGFEGAVETIRLELESPNRTRQLHSTRAVGTVRDILAVPRLIDLLASNARYIQEAALESLCSITGQQLGLKPHRWRSWYNDNAHHHRIEWIISSLAHKDLSVRRWASDELRRITGQRINFLAAGSKQEREIGIRKWVEWWQQEGQSEFAE